jgi:glycerophosphoryl diester phosphodiesterase
LPAAIAHRWITNEATFGAQAVYLDDAYCDGSASTADKNTASGYSDAIGCKNAGLGTADEYSPMKDDFKLFKDNKINYVAPPMQMLVAVQNGKYVPSDYAKVSLSSSLLPFGSCLAWSSSTPVVMTHAWRFHQTSLAQCLVCGLSICHLYA